MNSQEIIRFEVIYLGVDVTGEKFVQTATEKRAGVMALSALLTTAMPGMQTTVTADHLTQKQSRILGEGFFLTCRLRSNI